MQKSEEKLSDLVEMQAGNADLKAGVHVVSVPWDPRDEMAPHRNTQDLISGRLVNKHWCSASHYLASIEKT